MKALIKAVVAASFVLTALPFVTMAQAGKDVFALNTPLINAGDLSVSETKAYNAGDASAINQKALKDFSKSFKNVVNPSWYKDVRGNYIANFLEGSIDTKAVYDSKGRWLYNLLTYAEDKLPFEIRDLVKRTYYDFDILVCHEYTIEGGPVYIIKMQDEKNLRTVKIVAGEMIVTEDYKRG
ncbi:MAG TPA: hypothetical protein PLA68_10335 [Panacibacter sp.]|nr:hypothetical protein [Panacibacter sp.]